MRIPSLTKSLALLSTGTYMNPSATYYDSQSGQHVPIHNPNQVSVFYNLYSHKDNTIRIDELREFAGIRIVPPTSSSDTLGLTEEQQTKELLACPNLILFGSLSWCINAASTSTTDVSGLNCATTHHNRISVMLPLLLGGAGGKVDVCSERELANVQNYILDSSQNSTTVTTTSLYLQQTPSTCTNTSLGHVANTVASFMDRTKLGDYIWIERLSMFGQDDEDNDDKVLELCEELAYIDLPGPPIHSRLVLSTTTSCNTIPDLLYMGINKFAVDDTQQLLELAALVEEQGKELVRRSDGFA